MKSWNELSDRQKRQALERRKQQRLQDMQRIMTTGATRIDKIVQPELAAIADGDFDAYEAMLNQMSDAELERQMTEPGAADNPSDYYYYGR